MYRDHDNEKNKYKDVNNYRNTKNEGKDNKARLQNIDPRMAAYMGRLYVTKDKNNHTTPHDQYDQHMNSTRLKFKEYLHTKTKKEIIEEIEMENAAMTLLQLFNDLKNMKRR